MEGLFKLGIFVGLAWLSYIILSAIANAFIGIFINNEAVEIAKEAAGPNAPGGAVAFSFFWNGIVGHLIWPILCLFIAAAEVGFRASIFVMLIFCAIVEVVCSSNSSWSESAMAWTFSDLWMWHVSWVF